jgi:hypothetical protein
MPVQCTLGALATFKTSPGIQDGFVALFTGNNFPDVTSSFTNTPLEINGNKISLASRTSSSNNSILVNLDLNNNLPNVTFVSTYTNVANSTRFAALNLSSSNNVTLVTGETSKSNIVIRTIDSNNSLVSSFNNPPDSANGSFSVVSLVFTNANIIIGARQSTPNYSPISQPILKSLSNTGNAVNWTKHVLQSNILSTIYVSDFYENNILCRQGDLIGNNLSIFNINENGNVISNVITLKASLVSGDLETILDAKYISNTETITILTPRFGSDRTIAKFTNNTIDYQFKGNLNNSGMVFSNIFVSGNRFYTTAINFANTAIDPRFINVACFDASTGVNIWQKNIRVANANTTYNSATNITVKDDYVYIMGETDNISTTQSTFMVKLPANTGETLYNNYVVGNSGYNIQILKGNATFLTSNLANVITTANLTLSNANLVNTSSITDTTNTTQTWSYTSTKI